MTESIGPLITLGGVLITTIIVVAGFILTMLNRRMDKLDSNVNELNDKYETHLYWHMQHPASNPVSGSADAHP